MYLIFNNMSRRGFVIPVVAVSLMVAMGIGVVHYTILNHQQKQNNLIERELSSFYIAESGFQWIFSKLKFEKSPFFKKSPNGRQDFYYSEGNNKGYFEYFISKSSKERASSTELGMLIKGVFASKSGKAQDVTLLSTSMTYQMQNGEANLIIKEKTTLNLKNIFDYSENKNFSKYFKSSSFLERLRDKKDLILSGSLASPKLASLWQDLISLNRVNQKIDREIKFAQRLKNSKPENNLAKSFAAISGEDQALALSNVLLQQKSFQLADTAEQIDVQVKQASQSQIESSLKENFIQGFKANYAQHQTVILSPSNKGFLKLNQKVEMPVSEFVKLISSLSKLMPNDTFNGFINKIDQHLSLVTEPSSKKQGKKVQTQIKQVAENLTQDVLEDLKTQNRKPNQQTTQNPQFLSANLDFPPPLEGEVLDPEDEPLEVEDTPEQDEIIITPAVDYYEELSVQVMCTEIGGEFLEDGSCNQNGDILKPSEVWAEHCFLDGGNVTLTDQGDPVCDEDMGDDDDERDDPTPDDTVALNAKQPEPEAYAEDAPTPILASENAINPELAHEFNTAQYEARPYNDGYQIEQIPTMESPPLVSPTLAAPVQLDPAVAKAPTDIAKDMGQRVAQAYQGDNDTVGHDGDPNATAKAHEDLSGPDLELGGAPVVPYVVDPSAYDSPYVNPAIGPVENPHASKFIINEEGRIVDRITGAYYDGPTTVSPLTSTTIPVSQETIDMFLYNLNQ